MWSGFLKVQKDSTLLVEDASGSVFINLDSSFLNIETEGKEVLPCELFFLNLLIEVFCLTG